LIFKNPFKKTDEKPKVPLTEEEEKTTLIGKGVKFTNHKVYHLEKNFTKSYLKALVKGR